MKARVFLITFFAPLVLFLLASQAALTTWSLHEEYNTAVDKLYIAVILEDTITSAENVSGQVSDITGNPVQISTPEEQLDRFRAKFNVDVMSILSKNPFGIVLFSPLGSFDDLESVKSSISTIDGVRSVVYPDSEREQIELSFRDRHVKMVIIDTILVLALILQVWMAIRLEAAANEPVMLESGAPYHVWRRTFRRRAFIRGSVVGIFSAAIFLALRMALVMNHEVSFEIDFDRSLLIATATIIASAFLSYFAELIAFPIAFKKSR